VQGDAGHPGQQGVEQKKMEGRGGGEAQGVADPEVRPRGPELFFKMRAHVPKKLILEDQFDILLLKILISYYEFRVLKKYVEQKNS
jgi:hypothetical protein